MKTGKYLDEMSDRELALFIEKRTQDNDGGILGNEPDEELDAALQERTNRLQAFLSAKDGPQS